MGTFSSFISLVLEVYFFLFSFCSNKIRFARPDLKLFSRPMLEKLYLLWLKHASLRDFENVENAHRALSTSSNAHFVYSNYFVVLLLFNFIPTLYHRCFLARR